MPDSSPRQIAAWVAGVAILAVLGVLLVRGGAGGGGGGGGSGAPPAAAMRLQDDGASGGTGGHVFVDVAGEVRRPGVYTLRSGARVADAVSRAGGARRRADLTAVNLAAKLEDGRQVLVPRRTPTAGAGGAATAAPPGTPGALPAAPVDLNTATLEQLDTLDGVGPVTAQKILEYRREHGGFGSVDDLGQVPGIGEKRLAALRDHVRV